MGERLVERAKRINKKYYIAFAATFILGLLVHMFMFTNKLPNHDYVFNVYSDQFVWPISIGRCFLSLAAGVSSYFTLSWVNGLLAVLYLSVASCFIISIFELERPIPIVLCCALFISYPALADTAGYMCVLDGFMLALMTSIIGVWFWHKKQGVVRILGCAICLGFSAGVYQSYVAFAICFILVRLVIDIYDKRYSNGELWKKIGCAAMSGVIGMGLYYGALRLIMWVTGTELGTYMGVNEVSVPSPLSAFHTLIKDVDGFVSLLVGSNSEFTAYEIFNIIFVLAFIAGLIWALIKQKIYKRPMQFVLLFVTAALYIPGAYIFDFISDEVIYRFMMLYGIVLLYMLLVKIADEYLRGWFASAVAILSFVIAFNFAIIDNIAYENLNFCWQQTLATATMMEERITSVQGYNPDMKLMVQGTMQDEGRDWLKLRIPTEMVGVNDVNLMRNQSFIIPILSNELGFTIDGVDSETREEILQSEEYQRMQPWPDGRSVQVIQGVIVVKLSAE